MLDNTCRPGVDIHHPPLVKFLRVLLSNSPSHDGSDEMTIYKALYVQLVFNGRCRDDSGTIATFTRRNELPFMPCAGLIIDFGGIWSNKIDRVIWSPEKEEFECPMVDIFSQPNGLTVDEWIDQSSRHGWNFIDRREYSSRPLSC